MALEVLEARDNPALFFPSHTFLAPGGATHPMATSGPTGLTPTQIRHAYGFDQISFANGTVAGDGAGMTIAIVDAFDNPNIENDLHQFNLAFGLPDTKFTRVDQNGGTNYPAADAGWASEIALDVQWAHAIAPQANILLVEAANNSDTNIFAAVAFAARQPGVVAVSMSFGGSEYAGQTVYDSSFRTPNGHGGVAFLASSGDTGAPISYPASSPNVVAVGGTTLSVNAAGTILNETGWSGSGGGVSAFESLPAYQAGVVGAGVTRRANPDVAYDSDPNTGFPVYDSFNNPLSSPWVQFGGTSAAAPQWAAMVAIADQGRALSGLSSLDGATELLPRLYSMSSTNYNDITSGSSNGTPRLTAAAGYDQVTGRGSPIANRLVAELVGTPVVTPPPVTPPVTPPTPPVTPPTPPVTPPPVGAVASKLSLNLGAKSSIAGDALQITVSALDRSSKVVAGYLGKVSFSATDANAVLPAEYTFTAADNGVHVFTVSLKTAGAQKIGVFEAAHSLRASASVTVTPGTPVQVLIDRAPTAGLTGAVLAPSAVVKLVDAYGNLATNDSTDKVTVTLAANPTTATLGGTTQVTVSNGVAQFANLSISAPGAGYTLAFSSGTLPVVTSGPISVTDKNAPRVLQDFENPSTWNIVGGTGQASAYRSASAAHNGGNGLVDTGGEDWIYRNDASSRVKTGDTISAWLRFVDNADGRAYLGFGSGPLGTYSLVAAANTQQLQFQVNPGYGFMTLATADLTFAANHWYKVEVAWGAGGRLAGKVFDTDGTTLLQSVNAVSRGIASGGIALRATGSDKNWDTITAVADTAAATAASTRESQSRAELSNALGEPNEQRYGRRSR